MDKVYQLSDISRLLRLRVVTLRRYIREGRLKAKKIGRSYYISESDLRRFLGHDE